MSTKDEFNKVVYSYTSDSNNLQEENRILKQSVEHLKRELNKYKENPLMVCEVNEIHDKQVMIKIPNGNQFMVNISQNCEKLHSGDNVLVEQKNLTIIKKINSQKRFNVEQFIIIEKPTMTWKEVGGLSKEVEEIKEVIELPLKSPKLFKDMGITPPKGILLYGPPGTGKTILAKAVAASTKSTFIEFVGSELVQKFIGEGAKLVKEVFQLAREKAPAIIFIDELDALAGTRIELGTSGEREVQRTFMQLLAELDGFKPLGNIKVIGATNRKDILDPAIVRPGRLDRLIEVNVPKKEGIKQIFKIHSKKMKFEKIFNIDKYLKSMEGMSGAEIKSVCTEAGYFAIREKRSIIKSSDIKNAIKKVKIEIDEGHKVMFG
tara:strand:- start:31 stop:1161 length:1131 start_codon:yes stop_codon:yes gene_type:complete